MHIKSTLIDSTVMHLFPRFICQSSSPSRSFFSYHLSLNLFLSFIFALEIGSIILKKDGIIVFGHFLSSQQSIHVYLMSSLLSIIISSHLISPTVSPLLQFPLSWFILSYPILYSPVLLPINILILCFRLPTCVVVHYLFDHRQHLVWHIWIIRNQMPVRSLS